MSDHQKVFTIIVGQNEHKWPKDTITYNDVVTFWIQDGGAKSASGEYLIRYSQGPKQDRSDTLDPGGEVAVKDGMHFRVSGTGES